MFFQNSLRNSLTEGIWPSLADRTMLTPAFLGKKRTYAVQRAIRYSFEIPCGREY